MFKTSGRRWQTLKEKNLSGKGLPKLHNYLQRVRVHEKNEWEDIALCSKIFKIHQNSVSIFCNVILDKNCGAICHSWPKHVCMRGVRIFFNTLAGQRASSRTGGLGEDANTVRSRSQVCAGAVQSMWQHQLACARMHFAPLAGAGISACVRTATTKRQHHPEYMDAGRDKERKPSAVRRHRAAFGGWGFSFFKADSFKLYGQDDASMFVWQRSSCLCGT